MLYLRDITTAQVQRVSGGGTGHGAWKVGGWKVLERFLWILWSSWPEAGWLPGWRGCPWVARVSLFKLDLQPIIFSYQVHISTRMAPLTSHLKCLEQSQLLFLSVLLLFQSLFSVCYVADGILCVGVMAMGSKDTVPGSGSLCSGKGSRLEIWLILSWVP